MIEILLVLAYIDSLVCSQRHLSLPFSTPLSLPYFHHVLMSTNGLCTKFSSGGYWARHNGDISSHDLKNVFLGRRPSHVLLRVLQFPDESLLYTSTFAGDDLLVMDRKTQTGVIWLCLRSNHSKKRVQHYLENIQKGNSTLKKGNSLEIPQYWTN